MDLTILVFLKERRHFDYVGFAGAAAAAPVIFVVVIEKTEENSLSAGSSHLNYQICLEEHFFLFNSNFCFFKFTFFFHVSVSLFLFFFFFTWKMIIQLVNMHKISANKRSRKKSLSVFSIVNSQLASFFFSSEREKGYNGSKDEYRKRNKGKKGEKRNW